MKVYPHPKPGRKPKKKRKTDEAYLDFIRSQPCVISGQQAEPHHIDLSKLSGMGTKGSDRETIPLNRELHTEAHTIGKATFAWKYQINYSKEIKRLQNKYDSL